jgi:SLA1 homology domain 1, SHD1
VPDEDDPFAPAPSAAPKAAARRANPAAPAPEDDDPFAPLPAKQQAPPAASPAKPAADPAADPFKILAQTERPVRDWVDDTGLFRTRGQLVAILDGKVRILKETGRTTTVPLSRLSAADRQYVESQ